MLCKTKLIEHYESSLGAIHAGGHKMVIFPEAALKLIKHNAHATYYKPRCLSTRNTFIS